jgi:hypothetical protein
MNEAIHTRTRTIAAAIFGCLLAIAWAPGVRQAEVTNHRPSSQPATTAVVAEVHQLRFHSDVWMNLHHTLYASAWARRPEAGTIRALAGALPSPLNDGAFSPEERKLWTAAVDYYDKRLAARDLLFGEGMEALKTALAAGDLARDAVGAELRSVLEGVAPVYRQHLWPAHDAANRAWIAKAIDGVRAIAPQTIPRLEKLYATSWFTSAVRVDVVWVGNRQGAYTTLRPPHAVISSGDKDNVGWTAVETIFHEVSHVLVRNIFDGFDRALGDRRREHGQLWHIVQFYLTGAAVQEALRAKGLEYMPYMYATGLFDRAWSRYRKTVEANWKPYLDGTIGMDEAISRTIAAL